MRVVRWRKADTGVESFTITDTGVYFPVGKVDSSFKLKLKMTAGGQTAAVDTVRDATGTRTGYGAMNVSGTTEVLLDAKISLATGIIVTAISGTLIPILDDETPITNWPDWGIGRFPAKEDANAYVYGSNPPVGLTATLPTGEVWWNGVSAGAGWRAVLPTDNVGAITTFVTLGDSIDASYSSYASLALMDIGLVGLNMGGVPGDTTAQMLARLDSAVIAYNPTVCHYKGGTNDVGASVETSTTLANIYEAYSRCSGAGIKFIMSNIPPNNSNIANTIKLRDAQFNFAAKYGIPCFDPFAEFFNPNTGAWVSGASSDDKHPTPKTQVAASISLKSKLSPLFSQIARFSRPIANIQGFGAFANPLMLKDSNSDGVADEWTQTFGTPSLDDDPSFIGKVQNFTDSGAGGTAKFSKTISILPGDKVLFTGKIRKTNDDNVRFLAYASGPSGNYTICDLAAKYSGTISVILTFPTAKTSVTFTLINLAGSTGGVGLGEAQVYNLTATGLA